MRLPRQIQRAFRNFQYSPRQTAATTATGTYKASAAGDIDQATPTAANAVAAGDKLTVTSDGGSTTTATLTVTFLIAVK